MKKEDLTAVIVYIFILAIALLFGLTVLQARAGQTYLGDMFVVYVIGGVISGLVFNAVIFELAHLVGAKIGGYHVASLNILGLCWYKLNDRI
ncbi:MAG: hypothetical protein GX807_01035, partial [Erysipelotrichia bacterium]|nr:hypothetical protein [Erysipelotrichia bacterium]